MSKSTKRKRKEWNFLFFESSKSFVVPNPPNLKKVKFDTNPVIKIVSFRRITLQVIKKFLTFYCSEKIGITDLYPRIHSLFTVYNRTKNTALFLKEKLWKRLLWWEERERTNLKTASLWDSIGRFRRSVCITWMKLRHIKRYRFRRRSNGSE